MAANGEPMDVEAWAALLVLILLVMVGLTAWYAHHAGLINTPVIAVAQWNAELFAHLPKPFTQEAQACRLVLRFIASRAPWQMSGQQVFLSLKVAMAPWRFLSWIFFIPLMVWAYRGAGRLTRCRRRYTMQQLMRVMAQRFPGLTPATKWDLLEPDTYVKGPWRVSMSPIEWAWTHKIWYHEKDTKKIIPPRHWIFRKTPVDNLLINTRSPVLRDPKICAAMRIDDGRARAAMQQQLGAPWTGFSALPAYAQSLAAAFAAFGSSVEGRREGQDLLDAISRSVSADKDGVIHIDSHTEQAKALWKKYEAHVKDGEFVTHHRSFWRVFVVALLTQARNRGTLPTSQFLWLRAIDRTLWYALNQLGGRRPWAEAIGVWAHYEAEDEIEQTILQPELLDAVDWLRDDLTEAGWMEPDTASENANTWQNPRAQQPADAEGPRGGFLQQSGNRSRQNSRPLTKKRGS